MTDLISAILAINPKAGCKILGEDINNITWLDETDPISNEDIIDKQKELQVEYDAQEYARDRKAEYDALNQFELISDDTNNGTTTHIDAINAIKKKYPKG